MRPQRAMLALDLGHNLADRDDRGVGCQDRVGRSRLLDVNENALLQCEVFRRGLYHPLRVGDAECEGLHDGDAVERRAPVAQFVKRRTDPVVDTLAHLHDRIRDFDVVSSDRKHQRDAMSHQAAANDADAREGHRHPAV